MTGYRTFKTTLGHRVRVRMSRQEIVERRILMGAIAVTPFVMCWLFAAFARMI